MLTATLPRRPHPRERGMTLIEVLVTVVILAFGLLGLAGLQSRYNLGLMESYQRAQGIVLMESMAERILANGTNAGSYVTANPAGTGDTQPADCSSKAAGAERDLCEWSNLLKGSTETSSGNAKLGAMVGARGCVTQIQAPNSTTGSCQPGIYQVAVAWQGLHPTKAPSIACGKDSYGTDTYRRLVSTRVTVGQTGCKS